MANVNQIKKEIEQLKNRKSELQSEQKRAADAHFKARQAVISGVSTVSTLESKQTALDTYDSLISDIENLISTKESELEAELASEYRSALIRECVKLAADALKAANKCVEARAEFPFAMEASVEKHIKNRRRFVVSKQRFSEIVSELVPGASGTYSRSNPEAERQLEELFSELEQLGDFSAIRSKGIFTNQSFWLIDSDHATFELPPMSYPETFATALREFESQERAAERSKEIEKAEREESRLAKKTSGKIVDRVLASLNIF